MQPNAPMYAGGYQQPYQPYLPYAPYVDPYRRLQELERSYPQYGQTVQPAPQQPVQQAMQPIVKAIPVTSIDEARTANVLDGSRYLFYNTSNGEIYSRQFDVQTGRADIAAYERTTPSETPIEQPQPQSEIQTLTNRINALEAKFDGYERNSTNNSAAESPVSGDAPTVAANAGTGIKPKPNPKPPDSKPAE